MESPALTPLLPGRIAAPRGDTASAAEPAADFQSFLRLLTAQLENQDPLSPLDATEFVAQLADFSSVEQLVAINGRLESLGEEVLAAQVAGFADWIGREVAVTDGILRLSGDPVAFHTDPAIAAESVEAKVLTAGGAVVHRFAVSPEESGRVDWDGRTATGDALVPGDYRIELDYIRDGKIAHRAPAAVLRQVTGMSGSATGLMFELEDGRTISPGQIARVG